VAGEVTMLDGIQTHPRDPQVAKQVHDDIWDLFGSLTRQQSAVLIEYLENLTEAGIVQMPKMASIGGAQPGAAPHDPSKPQDAGQGPSKA
jgi:hypothetical protein